MKFKVWKIIEKFQLEIKVCIGRAHNYIGSQIPERKKRKGEKKE